MQERPGRLISCENLVKIYKPPDTFVEVVALQGLDLEVRQGELLAIVGKSGSGKTTLLNILGALDLPSAGRCLVGGYDLTRLTERERTGYRRTVVGHIWQQSARNLFSDLPIAENVTLPQRLSGIRGAGARRRSLELLELVGLSELAHKYPGQLSGGEQQRAACAVALANAPLLLLADEPTSALDSAARAFLMTTLQTLNRELGVTMIVVSHDPAVSAMVARTVIIRDGRASAETIGPNASPYALRFSAQFTPAAFPKTTPNPVTNPVTNSMTNEPSDEMAQRTTVLLVDHAGRLQLPPNTLALIRERAIVYATSTHIELWPTPHQADGDAIPDASAEYGAVVVDHTGYFQLPQRIFSRLPPTARVRVVINSDHIELWPVSGES